MSQYERSGFRDEAISRRHRLWGFDVPMVDIDKMIVEYDWVALEYDRARVVAVIEYKLEHAQIVEPRDANRRALAAFCTDAGRPLFEARYTNDLHWFLVTALNPHAEVCFRRFAVTGPIQFSEQRYVAFLYALRRRAFPPPDIRLVRMYDGEDVDQAPEINGPMPVVWVYGGVVRKVPAPLSL